MSIATRPIYNKLLRISSTSKSPNSVSNTDFIVNYPNVQVLAKIVSIVVKHVSFPNVFYNITTRNNVLKYEVVLGVVQTIVVPVGNYTLTALLAVLTPLLGAITQDPLTLLLTFTASVGSPLKINSSDEGSTLSPFIGIHQTTILNTAPFTTVDVPKLQGVQHVRIASKVLSKGNNFIDANKNQELPIVILIPNNVPFGAIVHYETSHEDLDVINYESEVSLQSIDIKLYDAEGNLLDLKGQDVSILLKIYYRV
jgi:hypothetical protein